MRMKTVYEKYVDILLESDVPTEDIVRYAAEFAKRHKEGWRIPTSTYVRCKDMLYYKESLERNSPYYVDLFRIANKNYLNKIVMDLYKTVRISSSYNI